jgi:hypothetical protein
MTTLTLAIRNELAKVTPLRALLAKSKIWDTYIFDSRPLGGPIEGSQLAQIVVSGTRPYTGANDHNTLRFPQINIDIWADPTRNVDGSVKVDDAKDKIEAIFPHVDRVLHRVDRSQSGSVIIWGTAEEVANKTGVVVSGSHRISGDIDYSPVKDSEGTWMGRISYGVHLL